MDAIEAMTVLRNRRILSIFAAVSYPRSTVISMVCHTSAYTGQSIPDNPCYPDSPMQYQDSLPHLSIHQSEHSWQPGHVTLRVLGNNRAVCQTSAYTRQSHRPQRSLNFGDGTWFQEDGSGSLRTFISLYCWSPNMHKLYFWSLNVDSPAHASYMNTTWSIHGHMHAGECCFFQ